MSKFTKGKWTADNAGEYIFAGQMMVAQMRGWGYLTGTLQLTPEEAIEIQKANARLIEAAPEMYAIVEWVASLAENQHATNAMIQEARKLIKRIDGLSSEEAEHDAD